MRGRLRLADVAFAHGLPISLGNPELVGYYGVASGKGEHMDLEPLIKDLTGIDQMLIVLGDRGAVGEMHLDSCQDA